MGAAIPIAIAALPYVQAAATLAAAGGAMVAHQYQAKVAANNAAVARQNAVWAGQFGEIEANKASLQTRAEMGLERAKTAASGIDPNSGSAATVSGAQDMLGKFNALTIRSNAEREAYGFESKAKGFEADSTLNKMKSYFDPIEGISGAGSTFLSTAQSVSQLQKTFGGAPATPDPVIT